MESKQYPWKSISGRARVVRWGAIVSSISRTWIRSGRNSASQHCQLKRMKSLSSRRHDAVDKAWPANWPRTAIHHAIFGPSQWNKGRISSCASGKQRQTTKVNQLPPCTYNVLAYVLSRKSKKTSLTWCVEHLDSWRLVYIVGFTRWQSGSACALTCNFRSEQKRDLQNANVFDHACVCDNPEAKLDCLPYRRLNLEASWWSGHLTVDYD